MKVLCEEQRTPEWFAARRGKITASQAHVCLMAGHTKTRRMYVAKIADDLEGLPDFDDVDPKPWFQAGAYYEEWARGWYSFQRGIDVRMTGLVVHDRYDWIGCSPDGLLGTDGLLEIKYRSYLRTYQQHVARGFQPSLYPQVQAQMYVCDRDWCDYVNYWRSIDHQLEQGHVQRIHRDQAYIDNTLLPAFVSFWADVGDLLKSRGVRR